MSENKDVKIKNSVNSEHKEYTFNYFLPKISKKKIAYGEHARQNLDGQLPQRPKEVIFCKKCVVYRDAIFVKYFFTVYFVNNNLFFFQITFTLFVRQ